MSSGGPALVPDSIAAAPREISLREATGVWARIGLLGFGGPAGQIALMHRILVEEKRWVKETTFLHALNFCMLLPGPEAQQLATYIGWLFHRTRGGLIAGSLFILPGFLVILGLSFLYVTAGSLGPVQGIFLGLKAAVIAIVMQAIGRIGRRSLTSPLLAGLAVAAFIAMFVFHVPFPWVIAASGAAGFLAARLRPAGGPPDPADDAPAPAGASPLKILLGFGLIWLVPVALLNVILGPGHVFSGIGVFFSKMAVVTWGGAYAVLAYVAQEAVQSRGWLAPGEMIDGLAMAETTPGPLIMVVQFVGFMAAYRNPGSLPPGLAGLLGSLLTVWVTFVPCFLWIFLGAPHMERIRRNAGLSGALSAITAAVVGVMTNLALWFAIHALFRQAAPIRIGGLAIDLPVFASVDFMALWITLAALLLIFVLRASVIVTLATAGILGVAASVL